MKALTREMQTPRRAKAVRNYLPGWWYVNHDRIEIVVPVKGGAAVTAVTLTKRQLLRAIEIMESSSED